MNLSIYPIPPDIKLNKSGLLIKSSITLTNFPNNCLLDNLRNKNIIRDIFYTIYILRNQFWHKLKTYKCKFGESIYINRSELLIKDNLLAIAIPLLTRNSPNKARYLPKPLTLRIDSSPIAERASYNFKLGNNLTSYQGEYPYQMASMKKGSFLSTNLINENTFKNTSSYLLLVNIKNDANQLSNNILNFYLPDEKKIIKKFEINSNSFNIIPLDFLKESNLKGKDIFLSCKTETFLPIFINTHLENEYQEINVEHTHPPFESFWGRDKFIANKLIKDKWII